MFRIRKYVFKEGSSQYLAQLIRSYQSAGKVCGPHLALFSLWLFKNLNDRRFCLSFLKPHLNHDNHSLILVVDTSMFNVYTLVGI